MSITERQLTELVHGHVPAIREKGPDRSSLHDPFDPELRQILHETGKILSVDDVKDENDPGKITRYVTYEGLDGMPNGARYEVKFHPADLRLSMADDPQGHLIKITGATIRGVVDYRREGKPTYRVLHMDSNFQAPGEPHRDPSSGEMRKYYGYPLPLK